jgi:hypothetical protein
MKTFFRSWTFWIAVCTWLVAMGGHYAALVPAPYGLVLANGVAIVYAVLRCLTKRKAGIPWKGILLTSEFGVTAATVLMNFLEALSKIPTMSPKALAGISAAILGLGSVLHTLSSVKPTSPDSPKKSEVITLPNVAAIRDLLTEDNLAAGVPDKAQEDITTPTTPIKDPGIEWFQYVVSDDESQVVARLSLVPSWDDVEMVTFLGKRGFVSRPGTCTLRVLQKDDKGMKVFQTIDDSGKTLTFESRRSMGTWKVSS